MNQISQELKDVIAELDTIKKQILRIKSVGMDNMSNEMRQELIALVGDFATLMDN